MLLVHLILDGWEDRERQRKKERKKMIDMICDVIKKIEIERKWGENEL